MRRPRIVALGGGSGPSLIARALPDHLDDFTAVVSVSDCGSSSGVIRREFDLPATGDIRATLSCLARLSNPDSPWPDLMEHRFRPNAPGQLENMALGNLLLTALATRGKPFAAAVQEAAGLLGCRGRVLPVSSRPIDISARLDGGAVVHGEVAVRQSGKPPIRDLFVEDADATPWEPALKAIQDADYLFIGPGNLFTSIAACLVVPGVAEAIRRCRGVRVYIPNTTSYPGQTDGFTVLDHVETVARYLDDGVPEYVILNQQRPADRVARIYAAQGVRFIPVTEWEIVAIVHRSIKAASADLLEPTLDEPRKLHKLDTIRHDPAKLGWVLHELFGLGARSSSRLGQIGSPGASAASSH
ncbi:MAG: YvcK family protein [Candidatus Riflebacteria bacterium]|nr:YvcK family protein [Candidatus Riflebacteria bacterium]